MRVEERRSTESFNKFQLIKRLLNNFNSSEKYFKSLAELNKTLALEHTSMGMSSDYMDAVKCGSTFVRIGSSIFGSD